MSGSWIITVVLVLGMAALISKAPRWVQFVFWFSWTFAFIGFFIWLVFFLK